MKFQLFVILAFYASFIICETDPIEEALHDERLKNIDVDAILRNERLLKNYIECLLGNQMCNRDGKKLKELLPRALENGCKSCDEKVKTNTEKILRHLINKRPDDWARLKKTYDPENKYSQKYMDEASAKNIKI